MSERHMQQDSCLLKPQHGYEEEEAVPLSDTDVAAALATALEEAEEEEIQAAGVSRPRIRGVYQAKAATRRNRSNAQIDQIVIHTPEGYEGGTLSVLQQGRAGFDWFLPPSGNLYKCNAFAKYVAWQAGYWPSNLRSIGIEQWDFAANMGSAGDAHYRRLAELVAWLTQLLDIPVRRADWDEPGLVSHAQITPKSRTDPGKNFDWDKLIRYTKQARNLAPSPEPPEGPGDSDAWRGSRWEWLQDSSAPTPAQLTYEDEVEWEVERVHSNPSGLPEMSRWEWQQDNSAPAPVVLTWEGKPAWKVERAGKALPGEKPGPDTNATAPRTRFTSWISYSVWGRRAEAGARELYGLYGKEHPFVTLHTYPFHDSDPLGAIKRGISASVDFYVTDFGREPNAEQQRVLQQAVDHAVENWSRLGLDKIIAFRRYTRDGRNWYPYKWWTFKYNWGKLTRHVTKDHRDHGHFRFGNWN